jgi:hypothetical protein
VASESRGWVVATVLLLGFPTGWVARIIGGGIALSLVAAAFGVTDARAAFVTPTQVGDGSQATVAVDGAGIAHVAYTKFGSLGISYATSPAWTEVPVTNLSSTKSNRDSAPSIAVDGSGNAFIAFTRSNTANGTSTVMLATDLGGSWSVRKVTLGSQPTLAIDAAGTLGLGFIRTTATVDGAYYRTTGEGCLASTCWTQTTLTTRGDPDGLSITFNGSTPYVGLVRDLDATAKQPCGEYLWTPGVGLKGWATRYNFETTGCSGFHYDGTPSVAYSTVDGWGIHVVFDWEPDSAGSGVGIYDYVSDPGALPYDTTPIDYTDGSQDPPTARIVGSKKYMVTDLAFSSSVDNGVWLTTWTYRATTGLWSNRTETEVMFSGPTCASDPTYNCTRRPALDVNASGKAWIVADQLGTVWQTHN